MALSNAERQKRWRERNRIIYNLRRRNARKGGDATCRDKNTMTDTPRTSNAVPTVQTAGTATIDQLREMIKVEHEKPVVEASTHVKMPHRSPTGMVMTDEQWEKREEEKRKARERGFEYDEYSQT